MWHRKGLFACNNNYRKTADRLFVHKNTVIYRMKQIESLLDMSLEDWKVSFNLQLCLQLRYLL
ncbi:MAG: PucR family transcriptional regulator [Lachnospiraceae bacterium]|nr:PucR family transcriptional regulator [Lachnospiraceae bacterium]